MSAMQTPRVPATSTASTLIENGGEKTARGYCYGPQVLCATWSWQAESDLAVRRTAPKRELRHLLPEVRVYCFLFGSASEQLVQARPAV